MNLRQTLARHRWRIAVGAIALAAIAWLAIVHRDELTRESLTNFGEHLNAGWFSALFLLLPLLGFPINIFLFLAGVKFGFAGGMLFAAAGIAIHNAAAFWLVHSFFHDRVRGWLEGKGHKIPEVRRENQLWFTTVFTAVQGPPYFLKLYLLALTTVPFRICFLVSVPVYLLFSIVSVGAGSSMASFNPIYIYAVVAAAVVLAVGVRWFGSKYGKNGKNVGE